jgi:molecular chaperone Hsp33
MTQRPEIFADRLLGFSIPSRHARGRAVRLDRSLDQILSAHAYPPAITHLLAEACESYFSQSEQLPTLIRTAVRSTAAGTIAAGIVVQHLAEGEAGRERLHVRMDHPEWEHVAVLAGSIRYEELLDSELSLEALVWRLFHEEEQVRVEAGAPIARGCRCSDEHYRAIIARFPEEERDAMRNDEGVIVVDCAFCSREFPIRD